MKTNLHTDYLAPKTQVIYISFLGPLMEASSLRNVSSESFQNESEYESIW